MKLWTTKELAEEAGVEQATIRQLLIAGSIQGTKHGRDWAISDDEAQRYLAKREKRKKRKK